MVYLIDYFRIITHWLILWAAKVNANNAYDDEEKIHPDDNIGVNLRGESINKPLWKISLMICHILLKRVLFL